MNSKISRNVVFGSLEQFYLERLMILKNLHFDELLRQNSNLPQFIWESNAYRLVQVLLDNYFVSRQGWWQEFAASSQFISHVRTVRNNSLKSRRLYEMERADVENKFTKLIVEKYCSKNGDLNWKKLLAANRLG